MRKKAFIIIFLFLNVRIYSQSTRFITVADSVYKKAHIKQLIYAIEDQPLLGYFIYKFDKNGFIKEYIETPIIGKSVFTNKQIYYYKNNRKVKEVQYINNLCNKSTKQIRLIKTYVYSPSGYEAKTYTQRDHKLYGIEIYTKDSLKLERTQFNTETNNIEKKALIYFDSALNFIKTQYINIRYDKNDLDIIKIKRDYIFYYKNYYNEHQQLTKSLIYNQWNELLNDEFIMYNELGLITKIEKNNYDNLKGDKTDKFVYIIDYNKPRSSLDFERFFKENNK